MARDESSKTGEIVPPPLSDAESTETVEFPYVEWEMAIWRVTIPEDLRQPLGLPTSVVRTPVAIDAKIRANHARDVTQYESLSEHLLRWQRAGLDPREPDKWNIFFVDQGRWFTVVIGRDRNGSLNPVSVHSTNDEVYLQRRWARGNFVERG